MTDQVILSQLLTFALTREQKGREALLLRVGVERVVRRLLIHLDVL